MKRILLMITAFSLSLNILAQSPQGFNYQAIARDNNGNLITSKSLSVRAALLSGETLVWQEDHTASTNDHGLFTIVIGDPTAEKTGGTANSFNEIDWSNGDISLEISIDNGTGLTSMGKSKLMSVPYALYSESSGSGAAGAWMANSDTVYTNNSVGIGTSRPDKSLLAIQSSDPQVEKPLFEVRNDAGNPVFAVFNDGVMVYVDEDYTGAKAPTSKGGFAVGGYSSASKGITQEYMRITPDSVRFWVPEDITGVKAPTSKGGFAVGGYTSGKQGLTQEYMRITPDSVRIWVSEDDPRKGVKGGFAVGGYNSATKNITKNFLEVTKSNTSIFFDTTSNAKGFKGGFAVGGYNSAKGGDPNQLMSLTNRNYLIGQDAGINITTGVNNTFFGWQSGLNNTDGSENIFIGKFSGFHNTTASTNIFLGNNTGVNNTTGSNNIMLGDSAGFSSINGFNNVFIGKEAGYSNNNGDYNIFLGYRSGASHTNGISNIYIGDEAGSLNDGSSNQVFIGDWAGAFCSAGDDNVFIGGQAGIYSEVTDYNSFIGSFSGAYATGQRNTFLGAYAGYEASGANNVLVGISAGAGTEGNTFDNNTYIGSYSGFSTTTGSQNVFLGYSSGYNITTGSNNVFLGYRAGYNETGSDKLYIANSETDAPLVYGDFANSEFVINAHTGINTPGYTDVGLSVDMPEGATEYFTIYSWGDIYTSGNYYSPLGTVYSFGKSAENASNNAIAKLTQLNTGYFDLKSKSGEKTQQYGVAAEDMKSVFPELVRKNKEGGSGVNYNGLVPFLVEAIKEQQLQIETQAELIATQQKAIEELKNLLESLQ